MKIFDKRYIITLLLLLITAVIPCAAQDVSLIKKADQLTTNSSDKKLGNLLDNKLSTTWQSDMGDNLDSPQWIQVDLGKDFSLNDNEQLVIYSRRYDGRNFHPTTFKVEVSKNNVDWKPWAHIYLMSRGAKTKEYSTRIGNKDNQYRVDSFRYIRFTVTANNSRSRSKKNIRFMKMAEFQIYKISDDEDYGVFTDNQLIDRFLRKGDYTYKNDFEFQTTKGIIEGINRDNLSGWCNWDNCWDADGKWIADKDILESQNFSMTDYTLFSAANGDSDIKEGTRQATHIVEHELYAVSGDAIALYPFYTFNGDYITNYLHWYDYKTGRNNEYLHHYINSDIWKTDKYGFFGGKNVTKKDLINGAYGIFFIPRNPYTEDGVQQRATEEQVIALDMARYFDNTKNLTNGGNKIIEPNLQMRHIFRIKDGVAFAEDFSGSVENNQNYINTHIRHITARSGANFQIRLDSPIPKSQSGGIAPPSKYYYKISNSDYRRVREMDIVVTDESGNIVNDMFKTGESVDGFGKRTISEDGEDVNYIWCGGNGQYDRMLTCDATKANKGIYVVKLIGKDINGDRIKIYDPETGSQSDSDLIVMQYIIEFVDDNHAIFVTENELETNEKYKYARQDYLDETFGDPANVIDFDEYASLEKALGKDNLNNYFNTVENNYSHRYFKWAREWANSSYSYQFNEQSGHAMYRIANHSSATQFHASADKYEEDNNNFVDGDNNGSGLYDRLFYRTKGKQRGYFYYVNASNDPGVATRLRIPQICPGSTIHVSAWVSEFSALSETANVSFNTIAVLSGSETRIQIHSFVTGYVPDADRGKWMNVYYSFVPDFTGTGIDPTQVDHYEIELDNNCKNSWGADYAIDNIRAYIVKPLAYAVQTSEICDEKIKTADVRIEMPFTIMLESMGINAAETGAEASNINVYYTFINKRLFYEKYNQIKGTSENPAKEAYEYAVLSYPYQTEDGKEETYGKISFSSHYESNPPYQKDNSPFSGQAYTFEDESNVKKLAFNTRPTEKDYMRPGEEYIISIFTTQSNEDIIPGWHDFDITDKCTKTCDFTVRTSGMIKIDGVAVQDANEISVCENQSPVIQIDLWGDKGEGQGLEEIEKNAYLDWYDGTYADFEKTIVKDKEGKEVLMNDGKPMSLHYALAKFRAYYPKESDCSKVEVNNDFNEDMRWFINNLATEIPQGKKRSLLSLYQSSFVFPSLKIDNNNSEFYVTAIPIEKSVGNFHICTTPTQVKITVRNKAPQIMHGIRKLEYPEWISSVPLRIGIRTLKEVSHRSQDIDNAPSLKKIDIPIIKVSDTSEGVKEMTISEDPYLYLVETNDPEYQDLYMSHIAPGVSSLKEIGYITNFKASLESNENVIQAFFFNDFKFKEGYYYTLRFNFKEEASTIILREGEARDGGAGIGGNPGGGSSGSEGETEETVECVGHDLITIKVVPEYQMWTGGESLNFNDDRNWRRVSSDKLLAPEAKDGFTTDDGKNSNTFSYAPLDFTKVIIPAGEKYPHLYDDGLESSEAKDFSGTITGYNGSAGTAVKWNKNPNPAADDADKIGNVTTNVQYDMVAYQPTDAEGFVKCRTWYANACEQIHFHANSEIMSQQHLLYDKAWVDMEMNPDRWYLAASPLQDVVAGDMYLPTDGARQLTELFQPINFNRTVNEDGTVSETTVNNRFAPAVFQRGWNKAAANVYKLPSVGESPENVAVSLDWSHVYNDVKEPYSGGMGYSVKTDVSKAANFNKNVSGFDSEKPGTVLFRFPKADPSYDYWNQEGNTNGNNTVISRTKAYRLNETGTNESPAVATLTNAGGNSKFFLAGNPFMAHLDMAKFFETNKDVIASKYWIMTADSQQSAIFDEDSKGFHGTIEGDASTLAPMQGFFVEANAESTSLTLSFTPDMITVKPGGIQLQAAGTRAGNGGEGMLITAYNDEGSAFNPALVRASADADKDYRDSEDVLFLDNPDCMTPKVFTIAGNKAVSINSTDDAEGTEVGVIAPEGYVSYLTFENTSDFSHLSLLDTATGEATPLYDGLEVEVTGPATGRFFLTASAGTPETELLGLRFEVVGNDVTVYAPAADTGLEVSAYTVSGMTAASVYCEGEATLTLDSGIYIITARASDGTSLRRKIVIN